MRSGCIIHESAALGDHVEWIHVYAAVSFCTSNLLKEGSEKTSCTLFRPSVCWKQREGDASSRVHRLSSIQRGTFKLQILQIPPKLTFPSRSFSKLLQQGLSVFQERVEEHLRTQVCPPESAPWWRAAQSPGFSSRSAWERWG